MKLKHFVRRLRARYQLVEPGVNPLENPEQEEHVKPKKLPIFWILLVVFACGWGTFRAYGPGKASAIPTATLTPTVTQTPTLTVTATPTVTNTPTITPTPTVTWTLRSTQILGPQTPTPTRTPTQLHSPTPAIVTVIVYQGGGVQTVKETVVVRVPQEIVITHVVTQIFEITSTAPYSRPTGEATQTPWVIYVPNTPEPTQTPWIIYVTQEGPTQTPWVITATPEPTHTPTETPTPTPTATYEPYPGP